MKQKQKQRIITFVVLGSIAAVIAFMIILQSENVKTENFIKSYESLVTDADLLTQHFQNEIGKWHSKQYDNPTMIKITYNYLPKFYQLINRTEALQPPQKYKEVQNFYVKSLQFETASYIHFQKYLASGNRAEDGRSNQLLSDALRYENDAFAAFKSPN